MMRHFVLVDEAGQIIEQLVWGGDAPTPEHREVFDRESKIAVTKDIRRLCWRDGAIRSKPEVELVPSRIRLLADGSDEVTIEAKGLEPDHGPLQVVVNGVLGEIRAGEPLTITTRSPGTIQISTVSETIFSRGANLLAVVPT